MEVVLDLYTQQHSESEPLICMDEAAMQLTGHVFEPIPLAPGQDAKEDYHYTRSVSPSFIYVLRPESRLAKSEQS